MNILVNVGAVFARVRVRFVSPFRCERLARLSKRRLVYTLAPRWLNERASEQGRSRRTLSALPSHLE